MDHVVGVLVYRETKLSVGVTLQRFFGVLCGTVVVEESTRPADALMVEFKVSRNCLVLQCQ